MKHNSDPIFQQWNITNPSITSYSFYFNYKHQVSHKQFLLLYHRMLPLKPTNKYLALGLFPNSTPYKDNLQLYTYLFDEFEKEIFNLRRIVTTKVRVQTIV